ncbi:fibronectin type III domain-containing protein [Geopsychrobacter electrodiphilus]|uniref:fibronectin type III domain-containing protein n=1 Tax=Geopsychrobacter electrodiphilus TaxID=225196 RepID=UPI00037D36A1|nr:fibronectin type III domain-containing protein [Geopsychrobacter electrodiphilus]
MAHIIGKILFFTFCFSLILSNVASAKSVTLAWDPSPSSDITGYKLYYRADSSALPFNGSGANQGNSPIDVGTSLSTSITGLADTQTHYFAVVAYDASGYESAYSNIVTSAAVGGTTNLPPILAAIGNKIVTENSTLNFTISASDPDGNSLTYSVTGLPAGASFNPTTHAFSWTPNTSQAGSYSLTFSANDGSLSASETITISVGDLNRAPVLASIGNKTVNEGSALIFIISGSDPDGNNLIYSVTGLPGGASFNATTHTFSWTPNSSQAANYSLTFSVSDGSLSDSETITISVGNLNQAPVLASIGSKTVNEGSLLSFTVNASDPDGTSLTYSVAGLPSGAYFNTTTHTFSWTPGSSQVGSYNLTFNVSDGSLSDSEAITINVGSVVIEGLRLPTAETGLPGVSRADNGDDSNNLVAGLPKGDLEYIFRVVMQDSSGGVLPEVVLHLNGYAYVMTRESGNVNVGATYVFKTCLGPAASQHFHFETRDAQGNILSRLPVGTELAGPRVELLNGKNLVGTPGDIAPAQLSSVEALGATQSFRWVHSVTSNGSYALVDTNGPASPGEGYVIKRMTNSLLPDLGSFGEITTLTYKIPVKTGWNLISNPYGGNVPLAEVQFQNTGAAPITWAEAASSQQVINGLYRFAGLDWGNNNIFESSAGAQGAILIPRVGYWIYVNSVNEAASLIVPKPQQ